MQSALTEAYARQIEMSSIDAFSKGVFGVPTMVTDGEVFFASDRLEVLESRLTAKSAPIPALDLELQPRPKRRGEV